MSLQNIFPVVDTLLVALIINWNVKNKAPGTTNSNINTCLGRHAHIKKLECNSFPLFPLLN